MNALVRTFLVVTILSTSANAGFELRLHSAGLQPEQPNQAIDVFLTSSVDVQIRGLRLGAFIGSKSDVFHFGGVPVYQYRDDEGNFQAVAIDGVQFLSDEQTGEYFWDTYPYRRYADTGSEQWARNTAQAEIQFIPNRHDPTSIDYQPLAANVEVKVGTFHIDTTGVTQPSLTLSLYNPDGTFSSEDGSTISPPFTLTSVITADGTQYAISDPSALTLKGSTTGSVTFNISHTPEPSVIGFAGIGLASGVGWLRARSRKRKAARPGPC